MKRILPGVILLILAVTGVFLYFNREPAPRPTDRSLVGEATTLAGSGRPAFEDGPVAACSFDDPFGIAVDNRGNVIVTDGGHNNRIRRITRAGAVETVAGGGEGFLDGPAASALFNTPSGIALTRNRDILVADTSNNRIRRIAQSGNVSTVAGSGERGYQDGPAAEARFDGPIGIGVDAAGNIFVADTYNDCIRKISTGGWVSTVAGTGLPGYKDGEPGSAMFDTPCGVAVDPGGNLLITDTANNAIRKISVTGEVSTLAGGSRGSDDGHGQEARFDHPVGIAITHDGFLFVTDESSGRIRMITPEGNVRIIAGHIEGFANGKGLGARFNRPSGIAVDRNGALYVADGDNYLIRKVSPASGPDLRAQIDDIAPKLVQPSPEADNPDPDDVLPRLDPTSLGIGGAPFPWPLHPQDHWHEIAGVVGEARGAPGGVALDHLHSGLDIHGMMGEQALSVLDDKVTSPMPNWGFGDSGEGIHVGLMSYIHVRIGRGVHGALAADDRFKARLDPLGGVDGVRVRRGTRFRVGDIIGTLNQLNHVHLNLGPWNSQVNPIQLPIIEFKDTIAPVIEPGGIEVWDSTGRPFVGRRQGRLVVSGDVSIVVTAYDKVDGNASGRKLGIYKIGYQMLKEDGEPAPGFETPIVNLIFDRLPAGDKAVFLAYAPGSGVSAYGTPTKFRYIVTNMVKHGQAREGVLRTSSLDPGDYRIRVLAEDFTGNRASGKGSELAVTIER
jgi:sugar lactone lactonase YvrE